MIDDKFKLELSLQVMKDQRKKMVSDFTDNIDYNMFKGLYRYEHTAEYNIYTELYHVLWIDSHWNQIQDLIEKNISLNADKRKVEVYFSDCFLRLIENFSMTNRIYSSAFYEILSVKKATLKNMITISQKHERSCGELAHAMERHKIEYQEMLEKYKK